MAKPQAFDITNSKPPSIIMEHQQEGSHTLNDDYYNYDDDELISRSSCGCFRLFPYFNTRHYDGETSAFVYQKAPRDGLDNDGWLLNRAKSLKEFSELVAGPKWKNFIRKFSKKPKKENSPFQYDPEGYALNFNDAGGDDGNDDFLAHSFSTRFAPHSRSMAS